MALKTTHTARLQIFFDEIIFMVPKAGLEPARPSPLPPQDSVSTNSTTSANQSGKSFISKISSEF